MDTYQPWQFTEATGQGAAVARDLSLILRFVDQMPIILYLKASRSALVYEANYSPQTSRNQVIARAAASLDAGGAALHPRC